MPDASARAMSSASSSTRQCTGVEGRRDQEVRVAVRGTGDLPQPEHLVVGLTSREIAEPAEDIGLALHDHHRDTRIGADLVTAPDEPAARFVAVGVEVHGPTLDGSACAGSPLQQEPVERACATSTALT